MEYNCLFRWACHASIKDIYLAFAALVSPVQNTFFLTAHYFNLFIPIAQQPGQAVMPGRLSLNMCLWSQTIVVTKVLFRTILYKKFTSAIETSQGDFSAPSVSNTKSFVLKDQPPEIFCSWVVS